MNEASSDEVIGCIYAFEDPGCPGLVKIGKDQKWPLRLRQAQAHTPRGMVEIGRWDIVGDKATLSAAERQALRLFQRERSCRGREWVQASGAEVLAGLHALFGEPLVRTDLRRLDPFDDWRDWVVPKNSLQPRWVWLAEECGTGRIKVVHVPDGRKFMKPATYSRHGIRWLEAWSWPEEIWAPSEELSDLDKQLIALWTGVVDELGFGVADLRLGWLRHDVPIQVVRQRLSSGGLVVRQGGSGL